MKNINTEDILNQVLEYRISLVGYNRNLATYRDINDDIIRLSFQWEDKPHRHVYDLCNIIEKLCKIIQEGDDNV
jgi:hypothetical protein